MSPRSIVGKDAADLISHITQANAWSQKTIAFLLDLPKSAITMAAKGKRNLPKATVARLRTLSAHELSSNYISADDRFLEKELDDYVLAKLNKSLLVLKGKLLKVEEWLIRYENHSRSQRKFEYIVDKQVAFLHNHHNGKFNTSILERKKLEHNVRRNIADEDKLIGMKAKRAGLICQISVLENAINSSKTGDA